ncbi:hypothetical protein CDL15_Pgr024404 [Punica granatum]|uniref:Ubiquitin-like domain-containing protein n=1 Tax=Punica granatum TaxID=22663 RepID=A0A218XYD7_PUNGR|nr:hypothetical protein CDL15_Pgr024404 [Punica granatum]PKI42668.1 hypothetical protein CRG98_036950 [Punica granatum]
MLITIDTIFKRTTLEVEPSDTVESLREKIWELEGIRPSQLRLIYGWKQLEGGQTLASYHIWEYSSIKGVIRLRGGVK